MYDFLASPAVMPYDASRGRNPQGGKTYYVNDSTGNNAYEGNDPEFPLLTLAAAYVKCEDLKNDYIFVERHTTKGTLTITKKNTHIIGLSNGLGLDEGGLVAIDGVAAVAVDFSTGNEYVELAGFDIGGNGTSHAIDATDQSMFAHIHHCTIGNAWSQAVDGIHSTAPGGFNESTFDHLLLGMSLSGYGMNFSIYTAHIAHCLFKQNALGSIFLNPQWVNIFGNMFYSPDDDGVAAGWGVNLGPNSSNCIVMHNWAGSRGEASTNNPYRDQSAGAVGNLLNGWADNFDGVGLSNAPDCP